MVKAKTAPTNKARPAIGRSTSRQTRAGEESHDEDEGERRLADRDHAVA